MNVNVEDNAPVLGSPEVWAALHTRDQMRPSERREAAKLNKTEQTWLEAKWPTTAKTGLLHSGRKASVRTNRREVGYIYIYFFIWGRERAFLWGWGANRWADYSVFAHSDCHRVGHICRRLACLVSSYWRQINIKQQGQCSCAVFWAFYFGCYITL